MSTGSGTFRPYASRGRPGAVARARAPGRGRARRLRARGFTLLELLAVVGLIGILAGMAALIAGERISTGRASQARQDIIQMGMKARNLAASRRLAHLVYFDPTGRGVLKLIRGTSSSCGQTWSATSNVMDTLDFEGGDYDGGSTRISLTRLDPTANQQGSANATTPLALCYAPSGSLWWSNLITGGFTDDNTVGGGFWMAVHHKNDSGDQLSDPRYLVFPLGAQPRARLSLGGS